VEPNETPPDDASEDLAEPEVRYPPGAAFCPNPFLFDIMEETDEDASSEGSSSSEDQGA
jgi:hypothetical protein